MTTELALDDVTLGYDGHPAVHHLTGRFAAGSLTAICGPNGAGKSTLIKGLVGALKPLGGRIDRSGCDTRAIGYLPQAADIDRSFPIDVFDFVALGRVRRAGLFGRIGVADRHAVAEAIAAVGLEGFEARQIGALSGGQTQRMLFARRMLQTPRAAGLLAQCDLLAPVPLTPARLAERGHLVATGGGPGAMEAANLGARFAGAPTAVDDALDVLRAAPSYRDERWLAAAFVVRARHAERLRDVERVSLGVPTFFYGHEPPNAFASHHAKYFANSTREEGLVSLATHGIVFAPGSGGTVQEIFQDACQNHYGTVRGLVSPMVLFGVDYWTHTLPAVPLLRALSEGGGWSDRVLVSDDPDEIIAFVEQHGPRAARRGDWSFCGSFCGTNEA